MSPSTRRTPQVAVLLPSSVKVCRDMRRGILRYVHQHGPWGLHILEGRDGEQKLFHMKEWGCTGIIGRPATAEMQRIVQQADIPVILMEDPKGDFLNKDHPLYQHSIVRSDTAAIGRMAAEYFKERKFQHFAFVGEINNLWWSVKRGKAFAQRLTDCGHHCHIYAGLPEAEQRDAGIEREHLCEWLSNLPKPIALLAAMDNRARQVIDACNWSDIAVPREIAVLGVDNDIDLCENANPSMSSILLNAESVSYEAATHLDQMMKHNIRERRVFIYGPSHVVSRNSTAHVNLNNPLVSNALNYIRTNACSAISVSDVVRHVHASRRLTEMRFREELEHSILEEIRKVRLENVCSLLRESDLSIGEITTQCGFESNSYLGVLFRRTYGCTMRDYRNNKLGLQD